MNKRSCIIFLFIVFLIAGACEQKTTVRWISIEDIQESLKNKAPINVAFDIDDTVFFSSPGYYYGRNKYSPGDSSFLNMEEFWEEMNNGLDRFSLPKECARKLIDFHNKRGDSLYFITGRHKTKTETVTAIIAEAFGLTDPQKVIFTGPARGRNMKIEPLKKLNVHIYYGDSDSDIEAAIAAEARPIRIMRAGNSTYKPYPDYGALGEEVLINSEN
jgi:acid phosphatase (class B)